MAYSKVAVLDLDGEVWKEITWIEHSAGPFHVSNRGRVKTKDRPITDRHEKRYGHLLSPLVAKARYYQIVFFTPVGPKCITVHRLVATAFLPNPTDKKVVNHKDSNRQNNRVENLEWTTQQENILHCWRMTPPSHCKGVNNARAKFTADQVIEIRRQWATGDYTVTQLSLLYDVSYSIIYNIVFEVTYRDLLHLEDVL